MDTATRARDAFRAWWDLGYRDIIPIIQGTKRPALERWPTHVTTEADLDAWAAEGYAVGLRRGAAVVLDIDVLDEPLADRIEQLAVERLGPAPLRVGRWPKRALLYAAADDLSTRPPSVEIGDDLIEVNNQTVVTGMHPTTGRRYEWRRQPVPLSELSAVTREQLDAFLRELTALPGAKRQGAATAAATAPEQLVAPSEEHLEALMNALPNADDAFPRRAHMLRICAALKAASAPWPDTGLDLWLDWCERWDGGENDPAYAAEMWRTVHPPYRLGWPYLIGRSIALGAKATLNGVDIACAHYFRPVHTEPNVFEAVQSDESDAPVEIKATPYRFPDPRTLPRREWLYGRHYIRRFVSATVAPSGVGKSSLSIVEALAMCTGKPLLGEPVHGTSRVWLWNGEDPRDELERRVAAAMQHYGLTRDDVGDRLYLDSGRDMEIVLATMTREGARIAAPVSDAVCAAVRKEGIDCVIIDPFVSTHAVAENDNVAVDRVTKCWAKIADVCGASVELVHHVRKLNGAEVTVEDARGAVALLATSRSARALARVTKAEAARLGLSDRAKRLFRFADAKNNLALPADDRTQWLELVSVALGNGSGEGVDALVRGDSVGVVTRFAPPAAADVPRDVRGHALQLIREGEWRRDARAGDSWIGAPIAQAMRLDLDDPIDRARAKTVIQEWIKAGVLIEVTRKDSTRRQRTYVEAVIQPDLLD